MSQFVLDDNTSFGGFGLKGLWTYPAAFAAQPSVVATWQTDAVTGATFTPDKIGDIKEMRVGWMSPSFVSASIQLVTVNTAFAATDKAYAHVQAIGRWY